MRRKRAYHHGNLRQALIDAALELIEQRGVPALTLREVARRVGVTHAAPHRHFAHPAHLRVMFSPEVADKSRYPELAAAAQEVHETLVSQIVEGQREGAVAP